MPDRARIEGVACRRVDCAVGYRAKIAGTGEVTFG